VVSKSPEAFRTISEVADVLDVPPHVLRFWESRFAQVKPVKRGGGRRYYRPDDVCLLRGIRGLLYDDGLTIKGVQKILREKGVRHVVGLGAVQEAVAFEGSTCQDEAVREVPQYPAHGSRSYGSWTRDAEAEAEMPFLTAGFAEDEQAGIVSQKNTLNGSSGTEPTGDREAGAAGAMEESVAHGNQADADDAARAAGAVPEAAMMDEPSQETISVAEDPRRARKEALKALVAELEALRERMAEGLGE
jgi:DNA-binding transcriptional MerR regulator